MGDPDVSLTPPPAGRGPEWDRWCVEMRARGASAWQIAGAAAVSETAVTCAWSRVERGCSS